GGQIERITCRRSGPGVVENAPCRSRSAGGDASGEVVEDARRIIREVRTRRPVPAVIREIFPSARDAEAGGAWRVGGDASDLEVDEQPIRGGRRPRDVPRLADDRA